jgi:hypothetical protein
MKITEIRLCPYKIGSGRAERFHLYKVGMTLFEYLNAGGNKKAFARDVESGSIVVDAVDDSLIEASVTPSSPSGDGVAYPLPTGRGKGRRRKRLAMLGGGAHTSPRSGPDRTYDPDEKVPTVKAGMSGKTSSTVDKFWVFATAEDESQWRLRQEIYSWAEADMMVKSVQELGWIKPRWWDRV